MTASAPPRLQDVRCPVSGHVVFQAADARFGTVIAKVCKCGRLVYGADAAHMETQDIPRR